MTLELLARPRAVDRGSPEAIRLATRSRYAAKSLPLHSAVLIAPN